MQQQTTRELHERTLKRLERFSYLTDNSIGIPFTRFRLGLGSLIALIPVVGDFADLILSLYVLFEARRVKASRRIQWLMLRNMLIDFFAGLVPIVGDAFDIVFKANVRNTELLRAWLHQQEHRHSDG